jgi:hypothetical protein
VEAFLPVPPRTASGSDINGAYAMEMMAMDSAGSGFAVGGSVGRLPTANRLRI